MAARSFRGLASAAPVPKLPPAVPDASAPPGTVRRRSFPARRACRLRKAPCRRSGSTLPPRYRDVVRSSYALLLPGKAYQGHRSSTSIQRSQHLRVQIAAVVVIFAPLRLALLVLLLRPVVVLLMLAGSFLRAPARSLRSRCAAPAPVIQSRTPAAYFRSTSSPCSRWCRTCDSGCAALNP